MPNPANSAVGLIRRYFCYDDETLLRVALDSEAKCAACGATGSIACNAAVSRLSDADARSRFDECD